jgi:hypothetical protein
MFKPKTKKIEMLFQQWSDCQHNGLIASLALFFLQQWSDCLIGELVTPCLSLKQKKLKCFSDKQGNAPHNPIKVYS